MQNQRLYLLLHLVLCLFLRILCNSHAIPHRIAGASLETLADEKWCRVTCERDFAKPQQKKADSFYWNQQGPMNSHLFRVICMLHSIIALTSGTLMMFYTEKASIFGHGSDIANKLKGSTPHDEQLIQISQSFSGLLLFAIGLVLFMVSFVKDREFHSFFAAGSVILYMLMALWRVMFEWKIEDLAFECPKQALGDIALAVSWVFFLVYTWREKYD